MYRVEPILLFDLNKAIYLVLTKGLPLSTKELVVLQARQLQKQPDNLTQMMECIQKACKGYTKHFAEVNQNWIKDYNFAPGALVLICNSKVSNNLGQKMKLQYLRLFVVVQRTKGNTYIVAELDGAVVKLCITAFCLILYFLCSCLTVLILCLVKAVELMLESADLHRISCDDTDDLDNNTSDTAIDAEPGIKVGGLQSNIVQFFNILS